MRTRLVAGTRLALLFPLFSLIALPHAEAAPNWSETSASGGGPSHTTTFLQNGKVLLVGGNSAPSAAKLYDLFTGRWTTVTGPTIGRYQHTATVLTDGRVLVAGGLDSGTQASCEIYDPVSGLWTDAKSMSTARRLHTATLLDDGRVLVVAGIGSSGFLDTAEIYDPVADDWSPTSTNLVNGVRYRHTATLLDDGRVLVVAGTNASLATGALATAEIFEPSTGQFSSVPSLTTRRTEHTATRLADGRVLVAGGIFISGPSTFYANDVQIYDPGLGNWVAGGTLTQSRSSHTATLLPNGNVLVAGGITPSGSTTVDAELYRRTTNSWIGTADMVDDRELHTAALLPSGKVLVTGGWRVNGFGSSVGSAEIYDPSSASAGSTLNLNVERDEHTATYLFDGRVLVVGGDTAELFVPPSSWGFAASPGTTRLRHTATLLNDGRVLVAGGWDGSAELATAQLYDPVGDKWASTGSLGKARRDHTATLLPCGRVLVVGGESAGSFLAEAELYDPLTGTWSPAGAMSAGRSFHTATLLYDDTVLVAGGRDAGGALDASDLYDPVTGNWSMTAGVLRDARYGHTATLLPTGRVLVAGGQGISGVLQTADRYLPSTGTWGFGGNMTSARVWHTATLLQDGRVHLAGGSNGASLLASAEIYDPAGPPSPAAQIGVWSSTTGFSTARQRHTATLLDDGRVLLVGGWNGAPLNTARTYSVGLGFSSSYRPTLATVTDPLVEGSPFTATGSQFRGLSETGAGASSHNSSTNYPIVQLRRLDNEAIRFLPAEPASNWSDTAFESVSQTGLQPGAARATVFTNGVPSLSRALSLECPPSSITSDPTDQTACTGDTVSFTVVATGDCLGFEWRKNGTPLVEGGHYSGTRTTSLTVSPVDGSDVASYDVIVSRACSSTAVTSPSASLALTPDLTTSTISLSGSPSVCTSCAGGTASETHTGGGAVTYRWGFRLMSGGTITDIPGETSATYVLNGAHFPGPGSYFLVLRTTPTCGTPLVSNEIAVDVTDVPPTDAVQFFTVTSTGGQNVLEWLNPTGFGSVRINAVEGSPGCAFPADPFDLGSLLVDQSGSPGAHDSFVHGGLTNDVDYCYTVFVDLGGGSYSTGRSNRGRPFDSSMNVKWAYGIGTTSMASPGSGAGVIHVVANDNAIHSVRKDTGVWPTGWLPRKMFEPSQGRPTTMPVTVGVSNRVIFLGSQDGHVYAFDADTGTQLWVSPLLGNMVQTPPSGMFTALGGSVDHLYVGTRDSGVDNVLYALDVNNNGMIAWQYDGTAGDRIGITTGQAAVDYRNDRVYFTSFERTAGASTVRCMTLTGGEDWANATVGSVPTGVALRRGVLFVGSLDENVYALNATSGAVDWSWPTSGDGAPKDFVTPDLFGDDILFTSNTTIWRINGVAPPSLVWSRADIAAPSTVVFAPGSPNLYVGSGDGHLYELDAATGATVRTFPLGDLSAGIGSPTWDVLGQSLYVGSESGFVYKVHLVP